MLSLVESDVEDTSHLNAWSSKVLSSMGTEPCKEMVRGTVSPSDMWELGSNRFSPDSKYSLTKLFCTNLKKFFCFNCLWIF